MSLNEQLRRLPSVDALTSQPAAADLIADYGRDAVLQALRDALDAARQAIRAGDAAPSASGLLDGAAEALRDRFRSTLGPAINATGVIIHTNLGRAPLSRAAQAAMLAVAGAYSTLEFDLGTGERGSRLIHAEALLCHLTGAQSALVVNNAASALVLALSGLARERGVIVSRGQLVEIGGGFRVPDIMRQSGAHLREVGTTNRTRIDDYADAIDEQTALLLRVHASNFVQLGFVESAPLVDMAELAHRHDLLLVDDVGSGALLDTAQFGLEHEPTVQQSITAGADLVIFSGDKLLGGPQAGIIVGRADVVARLKRHPLARALRVDKLTYAALTATLTHYQRGEALREVPVWWMMAQPLDELHQRAARLMAHIGGQLMPGQSTVGGGSLPGATLPTWLIALDVPSAAAFSARLRQHDPPVITRIADDRIMLDLRTVFPQQEAALIDAVQAARNMTVSNGEG